MSGEHPRGIRVDDATWKRFRAAAIEDDMSLAEELTALLDLRDRMDT